MESSEQVGQEMFMKLFLQHENALRAYARSILPDWESVDDVLQEASIVMWNKLDQLEGEAGFLPWAKVIVRFKSLNFLQKQKSDRLVFSEKVVDLIADDAEKIRDTEYIWRRKALELCLQKLTDAQRELVLASSLHHGAITELAARESVSVNSLYKKLGRLREKLCNCIYSQKECAV